MNGIEKINIKKLHIMGGKNSKKFWGRKEVNPPQPLQERRMSGRPAKNRRRDEGELQSGHKLTRKGRQMTCQVCYQKGNNKKSCQTLKNGKPAHSGPSATAKNLQPIFM